MTDESQEELLKEYFNICIGRSAEPLSQILSHRIKISVPSFKVLQVDEFGNLKELLDQMYVYTGMPFSGPLQGQAVISMNKKSALELIQILGAHEHEESTEFTVESNVGEVANIIVSSMMATIGDTLQARLLYGVPHSHVSNIGFATITDSHLSQTSEVLILNTELSHRESPLKISIILLLYADSFDVFLNAAKTMLDSSTI
jgi:chemotaxis protein CheC